MFFAHGLVFLHTVQYFHTRFSIFAHTSVFLHTIQCFHIRFSVFAPGSVFLRTIQCFHIRFSVLAAFLHAYGADAVPHNPSTVRDFLDANGVAPLEAAHGGKPTDDHGWPLFHSSKGTLLSSNPHHACHVTGEHVRPEY